MTDKNAYVALPSPVELAFTLERLARMRDDHMFKDGDSTPGSPWKKDEDIEALCDEVLRLQGIEQGFRALVGRFENRTECCHQARWAWGCVDEERSRRAATAASSTAIEREECAKLAQAWAANYPTSAWPEDGESLDCKSAAHGRHVANGIAEEIRARGDA